MDYLDSATHLVLCQIPDDSERIVQICLFDDCYVCDYQPLPRCEVEIGLVDPLFDLSQHKPDAILNQRILKLLFAEFGDRSAGIPMPLCEPALIEDA